MSVGGGALQKIRLPTYFSSSLLNNRSWGNKTHGPYSEQIFGYPKDEFETWLQHACLPGRSPQRSRFHRLQGGHCFWKQPGGSSQVCLICAQHSQKKINTVQKVSSDRRSLHYDALVDHKWHVWDKIWGILSTMDNNMLCYMHL